MVESNYLSPPEATVEEIVDSGQELIPDAPKVNRQGYHPTPALPPRPNGPKIDPSDDENEDVAASSSS